MPEKIKEPTKNYLYFFLTVLMAGLITAIAISCIVFLCLRWSESTGNNIAFLRKMVPKAILERFSKDSAYRSLFAAITRDVQSQGAFPVYWDFDQGVRLSRSLFVDEKMYGEMKYRYRPNIGIHSLRVWTGSGYTNLIFASTPQINKLIKDCRINHASFHRTDEYGFKIPAQTIASVVPSILFLGDSFTEGLWVDHQETFTEVFAKRLKADSLKFAARNLGVSGYSALEMSWTVENLARHYNPKIIVINLFPNDVHYNYHAAILGEGNIPDENYQEMFTYLARIKAYCQVNNIKLFIIALPAREQFNELQGYHDFEDRVGNWCKEKKVTFLNPKGFFSQNNAEKLYFTWDPHFSPQGHAIFAEYLYNKLHPFLQ